MLDPPGITTLPDITDPLIAWALGFTAGWAASDACADLDGRPEPARRWSLRDFERAGRRRMWDLMVLAGERPDPDEIERRLWSDERLFNGVGDPGDRRDRGRCRDV